MRLVSRESDLRGLLGHNGTTTTSARDNGSDMREMSSLSVDLQNIIATALKLAVEGLSPQQEPLPFRILRDTDPAHRYVVEDYRAEGRNSAYRRMKDPIPDTIELYVLVSYTLSTLPDTHVYPSIKMRVGERSSDTFHILSFPFIADAGGIRPIEGGPLFLGDDENLFTKSPAAPSQGFAVISDRVLDSPYIRINLPRLSEGCSYSPSDVYALGASFGEVLWGYEQLGHETEKFVKEISLASEKAFQRGGIAAASVHFLRKILDRTDSEEFFPPLIIVDSKKFPQSTEGVLPYSSWFEYGVEPVSSSAPASGLSMKSVPQVGRWADGSAGLQPILYLFDPGDLLFRWVEELAANLASCYIVQLVSTWVRAHCGVVAECDRLGIPASDLNDPLIGKVVGVDESGEFVFDSAFVILLSQTIKSLTWAEFYAVRTAREKEDYNIDRQFDFDGQCRKLANDVIAFVNRIPRREKISERYRVSSDNLFEWAIAVISHLQDAIEKIVCYRQNIGVQEPPNLYSEMPEAALPEKHIPLPAVPLEEQISVLAKYGIELDSKLGIDALFADSRTREDYENNPFTELVVKYCDTIADYELPICQWPRISSGVLDVDIERYETPESYLSLLDELQRISKFPFAIHNAEALLLNQDANSYDHTDKVTFICNGTEVEWSLVSSGDYIDLSILTKYNDLLLQYGIEKTVIEVLNDGQSSIMVCLENDRISEFFEDTKL